jgi:hypothetical protein
MSAKRKHRSANEYLKYLQRELSHEERHSFEHELEADPFQKEAMEGLTEISPGEAEEDLFVLHDKLRKRLKRRRRIALYSIAASVASILIVGSIFLNIYQLNPDAAKESLSGEEIFLQDEPETQGAAPVIEETPIKQATQEKEAAVQSEPVVQAEKAKEDISSDDKGAAKLAESETLASEDISKAPQARAPEADELMVIEAEPQKSRKKGRQEAAVPTPVSIMSEEVSGVVLSSEDMKPLPGATIHVKGSDKGLEADMEGRFSLVADQKSQATVIASYVGMETGEYQLSQGTDNRVVLQPDMATLDEVVVVAYGVQKETVHTGAVQAVDLKEIDYSITTGAEPEGGLEAYKIYMEEHLRFPAGDSISNREVVVLQFNVDAEGTISSIATLRSPDNQFTEVAIKLLEQGPSWNPARDENGNTDDVVRMRIVFKR